MAHPTTPKSKPRDASPALPELARLATERESARTSTQEARRRPLDQLADRAREAQDRTLKERGWHSR